MWLFPPSEAIDWLPNIRVFTQIMTDIVVNKAIHFPSANTKQEFFHKKFIHYLYLMKGSSLKSIETLSKS